MTETIGVPLGTRLQRIDRDWARFRWIVWIATNDFKLGTYLVLHDDGSVQRITERVCEGPEIIEVKGAD